jgi:hypothetical protein
MNLSEHGAVWSVRGKGAWFALTNGRLRTSLSSPGTDIDWYDASTIAAGMPTLADTVKRAAWIIAVLFIACVALGLVAIWL